MKESFLLNGNVITPQQVVTVSSGNRYHIDITPEAWDRIKAARKAVEDMISHEGQVVYGINTGFGNFAHKIIPKLQLHQLQKNLLISHAVGVGNPLSLQQTRALLLLRINTLAKGRSGISEGNLRKLVSAFNAGFISYVPEKGTVGASGDLAPLSHLALGLIGYGLAWDYDSLTYIDAKQVLLKLKVEPLQLLQKQGLALINGTQFMSAIGCEALILAQNVLRANQLLLSIFMQIFGYPSKLLSEAYENNIKNQTYRLLIKRMRDRLSSKSPLYLGRTEANVYGQGIPNSIKYSMDALAACLDNIKFARKIISEQINGATDNPLVYTTRDGYEKDILLSAGNFHGEYVAKAVDFISISMNSIGKYADRRVERYVNGKISKLPEFLVDPEISGINSGLMITQYTSAGLTSENKCLVKPASVDSIPTSAGQEDHVSMGGYAARKCLELVKNVARILSVEMMCVSQAMGLIDLEPCQFNLATLQRIRAVFPFIKQDQYYGQPLQGLSRLAMNGIQ